MVEIPALVLIATVLGSVLIGFLITLIARGQKHVTIILDVDESELIEDDEDNDDSGKW